MNKIVATPRAPVIACRNAILISAKIRNHGESIFPNPDFIDDRRGRPTIERVVCLAFTSRGKRFRNSRIDLVRIYTMGSS